MSIRTLSEWGWPDFTRVRKPGLPDRVMYAKRAENSVSRRARTPSSSAEEDVMALVLLFLAFRQEAIDSGLRWVV